VEERWDDVVVGAGTAGCCVARRLADAGRRVLVLEAGPGRPAPASIRSGDLFAALAEPGWSWPGLTARRSPAAGETAYPQGRGVGGSSAVNAMVTMVGERHDYDRWESDHGCSGRGWAGMVPGLRRALGALAPVHRPPGPLTAAVAGAAAAAGHPRGGSSLEPGRLGVVAAALAIDPSGRRRSAAEAYLDAAPPGLEVRPLAPAERVVLDGRRAVGVMVAGGHPVAADRVVVCAGAVQSPALLARSGVVSPALGRHARDHPAVAFTVHLRTGGAGPTGPPVTHVLRWSSGVAGGTADLQLLALERSAPPGAGPGPALVMVGLVEARSTGSVLAPDGSTRLDLGLLADEVDRFRLAAGVRHALALLASPAVAAVADRVVADDGTPCGELAQLSDDELARWLPGHLGQFAHLSGTCRMGPRPEEAVVDPTGAVWGHPGLWVVDASVLPDLPRATTQLPVLALAEVLAAGLARRPARQPRSR
jgi:choline dehydrogenase-like flavoprotein